MLSGTVPYREQAGRELGRMAEMGIIEKVEEPSQWCAGMVVVQKKSGEVRICVDMRPLNESVLREVHTMPRDNSKFVGSISI